MVGNILLIALQWPYFVQCPVSIVDMSEKSSKLCVSELCIGSSSRYVENEQEIRGMSLKQNVKG